MLNFWYSERCSRQIKLIICIATCVMIFMAAQVQQLGAIFIGLSDWHCNASATRCAIEDCSGQSVSGRFFSFGYFSAPNCPDLFAGLSTRSR